MGVFTDLFIDYTVRTVALGSIILGFAAGALGSFAVLRKQSLLGDSISHAALPGVVLAFMLTLSKAPLVLITGAAVAGWLGTYLILSIVRFSRIKEDGAMGMVLSVFFGLGMVLLGVLNKWDSAKKAGLENYLFGQASSLMVEDVVTMSVLGGIVLFVLVLLWKEFKVLSFDPEFTFALGFPQYKLDALLTGLIVVAIVIGLNTVGVVLMSAMVVAPGVAARQWTNRLGPMVCLAGFFGAISGLLGTLVSTSIPNLPTGPTIVIVLTLLTVISFVFAPERGLVAASLRVRNNRRRFGVDTVLLDLFEIGRHHQDITRPHRPEVIQALRGQRYGIRKKLNTLKRLGLTQENSPGEWSLTPKGAKRAESLSQGGAYESLV